MRDGSSGDRCPHEGPLRRWWEGLDQRQRELVGELLALGALVLVLVAGVVVQFTVFS